MAEEIAIRGSNYLGKERSPLAPVLLPLITFGIYGLVHYFKVNKELAELGRARGTDEYGENPGLSLLAVTLGVLLLIPPFVSVWGTWKRQDKARKAFGVDEGIDNVPGFLLTVFVSPVGVFFLQRGQNGLLEAQSRA